MKINKIIRFLSVITSVMMLLLACSNSDNYSYLRIVNNSTAYDVAPKLNLPKRG